MGGGQDRSDQADTERDQSSGVALVTRAFDMLKRATEADPLLLPGREALPVTETEARMRALRIVEVLEESGSARPDRLVQITLSVDGLGPRLHVAPVYSMRIGTGPRLEAVVDPFLRHAPAGLEEWKAQHAASATVFLFPEVLLGGREEALTEPQERLPARPHDEVTTQRQGQGKAEDCHGLAQLLRAWLERPEDRAQVARYRSMFGELTWRALQHSYPELLNEVEHELARDRSGR
jgi:hypothetical protein